MGEIFRLKKDVDVTALKFGAGVLNQSAGSLIQRRRILPEESKKCISFLNVIDRVFTVGFLSVNNRYKTMRCVKSLSTLAAEGKKSEK